MGISYGHSSGWVQTKEDLWKDFVSGKLVYKKIENSSITIVAISKNWATVRANTAAEGTVNDKGFNLIDAVNNVCYRTLEKYSENKPPYIERGFEPFDEIDLK